MYLFEGLKQYISEYLEPEQVAEVERAYIISRDAHKGQARSSGEPYVTHPIAVAHLLAEMRLDHETLMAALLHDVIEDTYLEKPDLAQLFNETVAELVEGVSKLDKLQFDTREEAQAVNFQKMMMAMVQDIRVILIKLADRTHNMRTLGALRPDKRRRIARETLEIYSPIANRLGIHNIKNELEDLGFKAMYPYRYEVLQAAVERDRGHRKQVVQDMRDEVLARLEELGVMAQIYGREKHIYSIFKKMQSKERQFQEVMDIYAFRVIVDDVDTCYRTLGVVHGLFKPRPGRFKDYIAIPKANGYQSLHTSLIGPHGVPLEIQIRTDHMDQMADRGVAAHWVYKDTDQKGTTAQIRARRWMQSLLELQQSAGSSFEFIENVKSDLFPDEIYCFTPDGRILELPEQATPVDFAYAVHTDIGHRCVGAKVDNKPYPLSKPLRNGQTVEIVTARNAHPNAAWLNFTSTARARSKIRQYLKNLKQEEAVKLGQRLLRHSLGSTKLEDVPQSQIDAVLTTAKLESMEQLLERIGLGKIMSLVIAKQLIDDMETPSTSANSKQQRFPVMGTEGMLTNFAKCCRPIPGDPIVAFVSKDKGLVVHHELCSNVRGYQKETDKYLQMRWDTEYKGDDEFIVGIRVELINHQGALAALTSVISDTGSNIHGITTEEKDGRAYNISILLSTKGRLHLANIMRRIKVMPDVARVVRNRN